MSIKKIIVNLLPLYEHYEKYIDPYLGIIGGVAQKQDIIMNEVLVLMGVDHKPHMYTLRELLTENLVTDMKDGLLSGFHNLAYQILNEVNECADGAAHGYMVRAIPSFALEVVYHKPLSVEEIECYMREYKLQQTSSGQMVYEKSR